MKINDALIRKVQLGFGAALLTLIVVGMVAYHALSVSAESDALAAHTRAGVAGLQDLLAAEKDVESACNAAVTTGNEQSLAALPGGSNPGQGRSSNRPKSDTG